MNLFWSAALCFAALEALALIKELRRLEYIAKPAVMLALLAGLFAATGFKDAALWFGIGLLFSLAGDVLLMISLERLFIAGLVAFLLAHLAYLIGFGAPPAASGWSFMFAALIGLGGARAVRRIVAALVARGQARMRLPIIIYSLVISIMLLSAMLKLVDPAWNANAAALVGGGAFLFYLSDIILAWNKFVAPIRHGRVYNIGAYHLGQILLVAGVALQLGK